MGQYIGLLEKKNYRSELRTLQKLFLILTIKLIPTAFVKYLLLHNSVGGVLANTATICSACPA